jgi:hypothetical protein
MDKALNVPKSDRLICDCLVVKALTLMTLGSLIYQVQTHETSRVWAEAPQEIWQLTGDQTERHKPRPMTRFAISGVRFEAPGLISQSAWGVSPIALGDSIQSDQVSSDSVTYQPRRAFNYQARLGLNIDTRKRYSPIFFSAHYEQDFVSGFFMGGEADTQGVALPLEQNAQRNVLRKAYARLTLGPFVTMSAGMMTSHWGLGLLANDGAHGWTPSSAYFGDPRGGDRVKRMLIATGPWTQGKLMLSMAYDYVADDDIMLNDDQAKQMIFAAIYGYGEKTQVGAYVVRRLQDTPQEFQGVNRDKETRVTAYDLYAKSQWRLSRTLKLLAAFETVFIDGETSLAPTPDAPLNEVVQAAFAARIELRGRQSGGVLDFIYASGDQNFDDGAQNAFKADPNFELGLLLFRNVLAAHTGRAPITASDPNLVGTPSEDLERFPSRGSVTNTIAMFPRGWIRFTDGVELYGGPLVAWGEVPLADPRNTRFNGGYPVNLLGGTGGRYLGTELDLGLRTTFGLWGGSTMQLGAEGAVFYPGAAFEGSQGGSMDTVYGGRLMARATF